MPLTIDKPPIREELVNSRRIATGHWGRWFAMLHEKFRGEWQTVTPLWEGASSDPAIGNGTLTGAYRNIDGMIDFLVAITMGSTTTYGSGAYTFSPPAALQKAAIGVWTGIAIGRDSGTAFRIGVVIPSGSGFQIVSDAGSVNWASTVPHTWATDDYIRFSIRYRVE